MGITVINCCTFFVHQRRNERKMERDGRICAHPENNRACWEKKTARRTQKSPVSCWEKRVFRGQLNVRWVSLDHADYSNGIQGTCCFCDWKSIQAGRWRSSCRPNRSRDQERWPMMKMMQITRLQSENLQKLDQLAKKEGVYNCGHTCVAPVTPSLNWVSSTLRSGGHGPHAAWSEYSHQWITYKEMHSPSLLLLCRRGKSSHPVSLAWNCVSCPAVHMWTVLWLHVCNMTLNKQRKTKATRPEIDSGPDEGTGGRGGHGGWEWAWQTIADSRFYPFATFKDWRITVIGGASAHKPHGPVKDVLICERILHFLPISLLNLPS